MYGAHVFVTETVFLARNEYELPSLLRFELVQLPLLPVDFSLLGLKALLYIGVLLLPGLHLVPDQGSADEANGSTDARACAGIAGRATDDRAQASATEGAVDRALLARRQRLRTTGKRDRHDDGSKTMNRSHSKLLKHWHSSRHPHNDPVTCRPRASRAVGSTLE